MLDVVQKPLLQNLGLMLLEGSSGRDLVFLINCGDFSMAIIVGFINNIVDLKVVRLNLNFIVVLLNDRRVHLISRRRFHSFTGAYLLIIKLGGKLMHRLIWQHILRNLKMLVLIKYLILTRIILSWFCQVILFVIQFHVTFFLFIMKK